ncbi:hypothetical protein D3C84_1273890 [compost metagenome]
MTTIAPRDSVNQNETIVGISKNALVSTTYHFRDLLMKNMELSVKVIKKAAYVLAYWKTDVNLRPLESVITASR